MTEVIVLSDLTKTPSDTQNIAAANTIEDEADWERDDRFKWFGRDPPELATIIFQPRLRCVKHCKQITENYYLSHNMYIH